MSKSQFVVHQDMNLFGASIKAGTYVRQKEWVGLTDEEIATWRTVPIFEGVDPDQLRWIVRKTEAVLKEKNT